MSTLPDTIREKMMNILKEEEEKTDLDNLSVLSRVGMKVASATSSELDADSTSASSTALIDLGVRLSEATAHGTLKEIILHNNSGYSILMAINDEFIVFGGLKALYRIGYYLGYLRELTKKLAILISGGEITEMTLSLQEDKLQKIKKQKEVEDAKATAMIIPTVEQDKEALDDLLGFLDDWDKEEKELMGIEEFDDLESHNVVSIPESMMVGPPKAGETISIPDQGSKEVLQESGQTYKSKQEFKVYKDEIPPIPLEDYTPMDVEEQLTQEPEEPTQVAGSNAYIYKSIDELPTFDDLSTPNFDAELPSASEYDTEFVLEEESEALDSVLKDLGWEEEE